MLNRLRQLREEHGNRDSHDSGFTLIELLVVVVIVGILLAIAIPLYLHFENGAKNNSAQSDVHNAIAVLQQCAQDDNGTMPASFAAGTAGADITLTCGTGTTPPTETITVSPHNTLAYTLNSDGTYTIVGTNTDTNTSYTYDSSTGQIT